jgi:hypothetical protein
MPSATDVNLGKWMVFRNCRKIRREKNFGERWNGDGEGYGFPSQGKHPTFHVIPPFLRRHVLNGILEELLRNENENRTMINLTLKYSKDILIDN